MAGPVSPLASDLCTACGLCCSGPLYNVLMLRDDEVELARRLGIPFVEEGEGPAHWFPCPKLVDKCCTVYEERPSGCRDFRCETLMQLDRGEVGCDEALSRSRTAWERVRTLEELLDGETIPQLRRRRAELREWNMPLPETDVRDRLNALDEVLDRWFRRPSMAQVPAYAAVEGRDGGAPEAPERA